MAVRRVRRPMRGSRGIRLGNANTGLVVFVGVCLVAYILAATKLGSLVAENFVLPGLSANSATEDSGAGTQNAAQNGKTGAGSASNADGGNWTNGINGYDNGASGANQTDGAGGSGAGGSGGATGEGSASGSGGNAATGSGNAATGSGGNAAADSAQKETVRITLPALDVYAIQLGAYTTQAAAESAAQACMARSGAGYIVHDGSYRVLAAAYGSEADAKSVQDQLRSGQNTESYLYTMGTAEATLNITATTATATAIKGSLSEIRALIDEYGALAIALDSGSSDSAAVSQRAADLAERGKTARQPFDSVKRGSEAVDSLVSLFDKFVDYAANAALTNDDAKVARSSQIKYNYIDLLCTYMNYIDALARLKASSAG